MSKTFTLILSKNVPIQEEEKLKEIKEVLKKITDVEITKVIIKWWDHKESFKIVG